MAVREVTRILTQLVQDDGETMQREHGPEAVAVARRLASLVAVQFREDSPFGTLWGEFSEEPEATSAQLTGALEARVEADSRLARRLDAFVEEYRQVEQTVFVEADGDEGEDAGEQRVVDRPVAVEGFQEEYDEGTYLYGNVPGGTESEGRTIGLKEPASDRHDQLEETDLQEVGGEIPGMFGSVFDAVRSNDDLSPASKFGLEAELRKVHAEIARGEAAEQALLTDMLRNIQEIEPEVFDLLLAELRQYVSGGEYVPGEIGPVGRAVQAFDTPQRNAAPDTE